MGLVKRNKYSKKIIESSTEDCGIYPLDDDRYLIQTVDFFTPIVNDPRTFGKISAANSLSDIYAMGGTPIFALNITAFPDDLPSSILADILSGAEEVAEIAGIPILGGHTIKDKEPKFGLAVTGMVNKKEIKLNSSAKVGDDIVLTKPIGTGILSTALKKEYISESDFSNAIDSMCSLNKLPSELLSKYKTNACTDVTGFGLLGHLFEICNSSSVSAIIRYSDIPLFDKVEAIAKAGYIPGGTKKNLEYIINDVDNSKNIGQRKLHILADAQTSGGLLITINNNFTEKLINQLQQNNIEAKVIGSICDKKQKSISII